MSYGKELIKCECCGGMGKRWVQVRKTPFENLIYAQVMCVWCEGSGWLEMDWIEQINYKPDTHFIRDTNDPKNPARIVGTKKWFLHMLRKYELQHYGVSVNMMNMMYGEELFYFYKDKHR